MKWMKLFQIIFLSSLLTLSGCWDRWELNELSIIVGMAIDKDEDSDEYVLTVQAINPAEIASQETGRGYAQAVNVQEQSKTIHESLRRIVQKLPRRPFISQLKILVISETVAEEGIEHVLDFFYRDHESRSDFYIVIAHEAKANQILTVLTPLESVPSQSAFDSINYSKRSYGGIKAMTLDEIYHELRAEGIETSIMGMTVEGNMKEGKTPTNVELIQPQALIYVSEIALFRDQYLVGWLGNQDSKGLDYLTRDIKGSVGSFSCPDGGQIALEVDKVTRELSTEIGEILPKAIYTFEIDAAISEVNCKSFDLKDLDSFAEVEKLAEEQFQATVQHAISATQELETDVLGVGQEIHRHHPDYWRSISGQWSELYKQIEVEIDVRIRLTDSGSMINTLQD